MRRLKRISKVIKKRRGDLLAKILNYKLVNAHFKRRRVILLKRSLKRRS
jgi:hypothetical protein